MNRFFYYRVKYLPDFTLSKYSSGNNISAVFEKNQIFIRQLHGLGNEMNISFHLYYIFNPGICNGDKLNIVLECECGGESNIQAEQLYRIISSFAIFELYSIENVDSIDEYIHDHTFRYMTALYKKQVYTVPKYAKNNFDIKQCYYSISEWKMKRNSRFFNTLKLICRIGHPLIMRIDALCVADSEKIINDINSKGIYKNISDQSSFKASIDAGQSYKSERDTAAAGVAKYYEKYMDNMRTQLQFYASVCVLSDFSNDGNMILDTLSSEVLDSGLTEKDHYDSTEQGCSGFAYDYMKDSPIAYGKDDIFDFQKVWYMRSLYTADELAAFFALPFLNRNERLSIRKETDPLLLDGNSNVVELGYIFDDTDYETNTLMVNIPVKNFCKHGYICGVPGSGKTYTMKHLIHSLNRKKVPFLVFEPAKREYRELYMIDESRKKTQYGSFNEEDRTDNIILFSLHANTLFPFHINPLEIPAGVSVSEYISSLHSVFLGAFTWPMPSPIILQKALEIAYEKKNLFGNYVIKENDDVQFPTISDLYDAFKKAMNSYSYQGESKANINGILESRIGSFLSGYPGEVFNIGYSSIAPDKWTSNSIIMELEALSVEQANFISLLVLSLIRLHLKRSEIGSNELRHVIFFEEAHNLIGPVATESNDEFASAKLAATVMIKNMLAEVRAYKEGIVIADQLPSAIAPEVLKNTSLKIAHRQISQDEREAISKVMSADNVQIEQMAQFTEGRALVIYEDKNVIKPFKMKVETQFNYSGDSVEDDVILQKVVYSRWYNNTMLDSIIKRLLKINQICNAVDQIEVNNVSDELLKIELVNDAYGLFVGVDNVWKQVADKYNSRKDFRENEYILYIDSLFNAIKTLVKELLQGE